MLDRGRKKIVYIGGNEHDQAVGLLRRIGVQDALAMAGQNSEDLTRICCTAFTMEEGERCMKELLTAVQFYQKQIGEEAARMLLQMLDEEEHGGPVRQVTLGYRVVERGSI